MTNYLPIENITYKTKLSKEDLFQRLSENVEKKKTGFAALTHTYKKPYMGDFADHTFDIKRVINYRNSFIPYIKGEVFADVAGTTIKVNMKPHTFIFVFMTFWFGSALVGCIGAIYALFTQPFSAAYFIPFGMVLFAIALVFGGFKIESRRSRKDLKRILEAEIE